MRRGPSTCMHHHTLTVALYSCRRCHSTGSSTASAAAAVMLLKVSRVTRREPRETAVVDSSSSCAAVRASRQPVLTMWPRLRERDLIYSSVLRGIISHSGLHWHCGVPLAPAVPVLTVCTASGRKSSQPWSPCTCRNRKACCSQNIY